MSVIYRNDRASMRVCYNSHHPSFLSCPCFIDARPIDEFLFGNHLLQHSNIPSFPNPRLKFSVDDPFPFPPTISVSNDTVFGICQLSWVILVTMPRSPEHCIRTWLGDTGCMDRESRTPGVNSVSQSKRRPSEQARQAGKSFVHPMTSSWAMCTNLFPSLIYETSHALIEIIYRTI